VQGLKGDGRQQALLQKAEADGGEFVGYFLFNVDDANYLATSFVAAYPSLSQQHLGGGGGENFERLINEASAGRHEWGVAVVNPEHIAVLRQQDLVAQYTGPAFDAIPEQYRDPDGEWVDLYVAPQATMYNTNEVSDPPGTLNDLTDPRFKGRISMDTEDFEWFQVVLETLGEEEGLKANEPVLIRGGSENRESTANGETIVTVTQNDYDIAELAAEGAPVDYVYLEEANVVKHGPMVLSKNAPNPAAAILFFEWAISLEGQQLLHDETLRPPVHPDVADQFPDVAAARQGATLRAVDLNNFARNYEEITSTFREIFVTN
jgi:iron(III) transport system substrate-binding protein